MKKARRIYVCLEDTPVGWRLVERGEIGPAVEGDKGEEGRAGHDSLEDAALGDGNHDEGLGRHGENQTHEH